jgi:hypothetical protein
LACDGEASEVEDFPHDPRFESLAPPLGGGTPALLKDGAGLPDVAAVVFRVAEEEATVAGACGADHGASLGAVDVLHGMPARGSLPVSGLGTTLIGAQWKQNVIYGALMVEQRGHNHPCCAIRAASKKVLMLPAPRFG